MTKNELINDMNFRFRCCDYGLNWDDFEAYGEVIILNTSKKGIYVLLDKNYNTIGIHKVEFANMHLSKEQLADGYTELYNLVDKDSGYSFPYPFQNFSLKQIVEISNRIEIHETNHGHSSNILVNGDIVSCDNDVNYPGLLSYIKFLGEQVKQYFLNAYQMKMMGFDYPDVYSYVRSLMNNVNECIENNIKNNNRPFPVNVIEYLGQDRKSVEKYNHALYNIIDLLMKEKGFKIKGGFKHYKEIEPIEKNVEDLSIISINLLKILELSDEDLNKKMEEICKTMKVRYIDLKTWLEEDTLQEKNPMLKRDKK